MTNLHDILIASEFPTNVHDMFIAENLMPKYKIKTTSGIPPLSFMSKGNPLTEWSITGKTFQNGTPSLENPVEVQGVGDYNSETGKYKIPVKITVNEQETTIPIYLNSPLFSDETINSEGVREVKWEKLVLTGSEVWGKDHDVDDDLCDYMYIRLPKANIKTVVTNCFEKGKFGDLFEKECFATTSVCAFSFLKSKTGITPDDDTLTRLEKMKKIIKNKYYENNPIIVWYQSQTPTSETFSSPQIPTFKGTTIIDIDTEVKPAEMYVKYKD